MLNTTTQNTISLVAAPTVAALTVPAIALRIDVLVRLTVLVSIQILVLAT
ncbi:MAG: hypothetical protein AAGJ10_12775 [Bacteroidota bacterium]